MTSFDEIQHPRATSGEFTTKEQSAPETALAAPAARPAFEAFEKAQRNVWTAERIQRAAAVQAMNEAVRELAPDAVTVRLQHAVDWDVSKLNFSSVLDADGVELELNQDAEDTLSEGISVLGYAFPDYDDAKDFFDRDNEDSSIFWHTVEASTTPTSAWSAQSQIADIDESIQILVEQKSRLALGGIHSALLAEYPTATSVTVIASGRLGRKELTVFEGDTKIDSVLTRSAFAPPSDSFLSRLTDLGQHVLWSDDVKNGDGETFPIVRT